MRGVASRDLVIGVMFLLVALNGSLLQAQATTRPATQPAETPPDARFVIQKNTLEGPEVLGFAEDGKTVYVCAWLREVNAWRVAAYYWPEAAACAAGLYLLIRLVRAAREQQDGGEEYCRKCNYMLRGLESDRCPECGTELTGRNRVRGRRRRRRLLVTAELLAIVVGGYVLAQGRVPRVGAFSNWLSLRSTSLAAWGSIGQRSWITQHNEENPVVVLADMEAGKVLGEVCRFKLNTSERLVSPSMSGDASWSWDGRFLFCEIGRVVSETGGIWIAGQNGRMVERTTGQVDVKTGKVVRRFPQGAMVAAEGPGRTVFAEAEGRMVAWDVAIGRKINEWNLGPGTQGTSFRPLVLAGRDLALVSVTKEKVKNQVVGYRRKETMSLWDPRADRVLRSFEVESDKWCCDSGKVYALRGEETGLTIDVWDVSSGQKVDTMRLRRGYPMRVTVKGGIMVVAVWSSYSERGTMVVDLKARAEKEWIRTAASAMGDPWIISSDGRKLVCDCLVRTGRNLDWEIRMYKMRE